MTVIGLIVKINHTDQIPPTGMYKMGIRNYDSDLGRWTQQDPAYNRTNLPGGNVYACASYNPTNRTDPTGAYSYQRLAAEAGWYVLVATVCGAIGLASGTVIGPYLAALYSVFYYIEGVSICWTDG